MKGFQNLTETEQRTCAELAGKAGLTFHDAHHIWLFWLEINPTLVMHLHSGVQVLIAYPEGRY